MEFLHLYLGAAALTVWSAAERRFVPSFLGGLLWAAGTVSALIDGAGLDIILAVTLALLLLSTVPPRQTAADDTSPHSPPQSGEQHGDTGASPRGQEVIPTPTDPLQAGGQRHEL